jgi:molecular chaperone Hsp33
MKDHLVKATAEGVRIYAAVTTDLVNEAIRRHDCYPVAAAALGRTMTGALLLAANLKNKEALTVTFDGHGPLGKVTADATPEGFVRGYVGEPHVNLPLNKLGKIDVGGGVGTDGMLTVTRFTGLKNPITGSVEISDGEIADDLTKYLYVSEQTPSSVGLGVLVDPDFHCIGAGGFILQPLPDVSDEVLARLEKNIQSIHSVSHMVERGLDAKGIIGEVLQGFDVEYLATTDLAFRCQCSKGRISDVLLGLNLTDLKSLVDDGHAEVVCHFCNEKYQFSGEELEAIYHVAQKQRLSPRK